MHNTTSLAAFLGSSTSASDGRNRTVSQKIPLMKNSLRVATAKRNVRVAMVPACKVALVGCW